MAPEFIKPKPMPNSDPNPYPGIWPLMACPSENLGPLLNGINTICLGVMAILRHQSKADIHDNPHPHPSHIANPNPNPHPNLHPNPDLTLTLTRRTSTTTPPRTCSLSS